MTAEVASAFVTLVPSFKGGQSAIARQLNGPASAAGRAAGERYSQGMSSSIAARAKTMFSPLLKGSAILGTIGAAGAAMGLKAAAANEQASISFTTMLGSAEKAGKFLKDLQSFAASTPFEFPELQTAASTLVSAGVEADKVIPIMRTLGDVTSGMGTGSEGVKRATVALQQMNAAGRITGEDLNQLRDAGIPVYDLLAKATGKSKEAVAELASKGKLGKKELGEMMKALESGKGLERFSGLMDKQSASLSGMWSTFKDVTGQGLAQAITPLVPILKDGLGGASAFLADQMPKIADGLETVVTGAKGLFDLVVKGDFTGALSKVFGWDEDSKAVDIIFRIRDAVIGLIDGFKKGEGPGGQFRTVLSNVWDIVSSLLGGLGSLVGSVTGLSGGMDDAGGSGSALSSTLGKVLDVVVSVTGWLAKHSTVVKSVVAAVLAGVAAFKIITGVAKAYAAVQAALNVVLTANPIGLIIIAIAALAAGLVVAYKNSDTFRAVCDKAFKAIGEVVRWLWNKVIAPVIRFLIEGFAKVARFYATMLRGLSKVPGFGWAAKAADALEGAADKAETLSKKIKDIPSQKAVTITVSARATTGRIKVGNESVNIGMRAKGGPVKKGSPYIVGEKRPELFVPETDGYIVPRVPTNGSGGVGSSGAPLVGSLTIQSSGNTKDDLDEALWQLRRIRRGGVYA